MARDQERGDAPGTAQFEALFAGLDWRRVRPLEVAAPAAAE